MKANALLFAATLLSLYFQAPLYAQFPGMGGGAAQPDRSGGLPGTAGDTSPKGTAKITGYVVDSAQTKAGSGVPVEFASIALYNRATGKAVDGAVADDKGKFTLNKLVAGQ